MGLFSGLFGNDDTNKKEVNGDATLELRKENLNISKNKVQKGEVELGKEIIEEHKSMDIPVSHEEVVIERKSLNNKASDTPISEQESIRIPVSEEKVDVSKNTVVTGEITARKREVEQNEHIDETLKHEEATINKVGDLDIIDNKNNQ